VLATGSLGSAGALLEVAFPRRPGTTCRQIFRFRETSLSALPLRGPAGVLPECDDAAWVSRWERPASDAPALWVRERSRATADGPERDVEAYAFAGFDLAIVPERSRHEIRGVAIPPWPDPVYYPRSELLETLFPRTDVARLRSRPRVRIVASQLEHRFELRVLARGEEHVFPICRAARTGEDEVLLTGEASGRTLRARVKLGGTEEKSPVEAAVQGLGPEVDGFYVPVLRFREGGFELYPTAEDELALSLPGNWSGPGAATTSVSVISAFPAVLRFAGREVTLSIDRAPDGTDLLLVPTDGSRPDTALRWMGPDRIARIPVTCETDHGCRVSGQPEPLRHVGSRM
jgi:hypothetical protein